MVGMMLWFNSLGQPGGEAHPTPRMGSGEGDCPKENQGAFARERTNEGQDSKKQTGLFQQWLLHIYEEVLDRQNREQALTEASGLVW